MMNPIGIRNEDQIGTRDPWFADRTTATSVLEHGGAVPGGTRVRRSRWPAWRSATGRSCGRRAGASSGWPMPSATTGTTPDATHAAPGSTSDPGSAPRPGSAHRAPGAGWPRPAPRRWTGWPSGSASTASLPSALSRLTLPAERPHPRRRSPVEVVLHPREAGPSRRVERARGGGRRRRGRACISCRSRRGRAGCGRPSCRPGVGAGRRRRAARPR
jgi:hypothetical protein